MSTPFTILYLSISIHVVSGFNVDISSGVVHRIPNIWCPKKKDYQNIHEKNWRSNCMFGFDVAQHEENGRTWALIGAPKSRSTRSGLKRPGAVFKCQPHKADSCEIIPFDTEGDSSSGSGRPFDIKEEQWFGSLVRSSGKDGSIMACAPRYVWFSQNFMRREPVGTCFLAKNGLSEHEFTEISPCRTRNWGYHRQGSCQAGISGAISKDGSRMYIGAPGSWYWQGQVYSMDISDTTPTLSDSKDKGRGGKKLPHTHHQSLGYTSDERHNRLDLRTGEGMAEDDDSYLGYSMTTGRFTAPPRPPKPKHHRRRYHHKGGAKKQHVPPPLPPHSKRVMGVKHVLRNSGADDVAVGMPRAANLNGKVLIFDNKLRNLYNLTGDQIGAYFGFSITSGDFNGDGLDDLAIGAPMYTTNLQLQVSSGIVKSFSHTPVKETLQMRRDLSGQLESNIETGRVYIIYQNTEHKFKTYDILNGKENKGRFGHAVACAGNLNLDTHTNAVTGASHSVQDLVVGAPYGGSDGRGAVFIYFGSKHGLTSNGVFQKIEASDLILSGLIDTISTFGWSLSGGVDVDFNEYPDILVGAYGSDKAVNLKSAPIVYVDANIEMSGSSSQVDLQELECQLNNAEQTPVPCRLVTIHLKYDGIAVPLSLDLQIFINLDARKEKNSSKRMFFYATSYHGLSHSNHTVTLSKGVLHQHTFKVYMLPIVKDRLTPMDIEVSYALPHEATDDIFQEGRYVAAVDRLRPVLDRFVTPPHVIRSVYIHNNCGSDNLCLPNLNIDLLGHNIDYVVGSEKRMEMALKISNSGEDAFETSLDLRVPQGLDYINCNFSRNTLSRGVNSLESEVVEGSNRLNSLCSPPTEENDGVLHCELGNPMVANTEITMFIFFKPNFDQSKVVYSSDRQTFGNEEYQFNAKLSSSNAQEVSAAGSSLDIDIPVVVEAQLRVTGASKPSFVKYNISSSVHQEDEEGGSSGVNDNQDVNQVKYYESEADLGPEVVHVYNVKNKGPSPIYESEVFIMWPSFDVNNDHLLYLLGVDYDGEKVTCQPMENVNPLNLRPSPSLSAAGGSHRQRPHPSQPSPHSNIRGNDNFISISRRTTTSTTTESPVGMRRQQHHREFKQEMEERARGREYQHERGQFQWVNRDQNNHNEEQREYVNSGVNRGLEYHGHSVNRMSHENNQNGEQRGYENGGANRGLEYHSHSVERDGGHRSRSNSGLHQNSNRYSGVGLSQVVGSSSHRSGGDSHHHQDILVSGHNGPSSVSGANVELEQHNASHGYTSSSFNHSSSMSSISSSHSSASSLYTATGWRRLQNGTYIRTYQNVPSLSEPLPYDPDDDMYKSNPDQEYDGNEDLNLSNVPQVVSREHHQEEIDYNPPQTSHVDQDDPPRSNKIEDLYQQSFEGRGFTTESTILTGEYSTTSIEKKGASSLNVQENEGEWIWSDENDSWEWVEHDDSSSTQQRFKRSESPESLRRYRREESESGSRKAAASFEDHIYSCADSPHCSLLQCKVTTILHKGDSVLFKIRSRLVTHTQLKSHADKVRVSSKLVTRVTQMPHNYDPRTIPYEIFGITTQVFPSQVSGGWIPWWVWVIAAIFGIFLLAAIIYCLNKCGFFNRQRPVNNKNCGPLNATTSGGHPETQPLKSSYY